MFQLLQQLSESFEKQKFKSLMLRVQQECEDADIDVKLTKFGDEDGPSSNFTASKADTSLKMCMHAPNEWLGGRAENLVVLAIDWDGDNNYDVDGDCVFEPAVAADIVKMIKLNLDSLEE
jgi:CTP:phosphocholine cytidylyltransferase-like protein